tara:strand:+ start:827 stop:1306 length:480 start_codon:yes stop_codon:yes gene_type:complete
MIDPITAITAATTAYKTVKKLVAAGRDVEDTMGQLAKWYGAVSDLNEAERQAKNPPLFKKLVSSKSVNQEAMELFAHKKRVQAQERDIRELLLYAYGKEAYLELMDMRKQIRAEREQAIYAQARRRKEVFWNTITFLVILVLVSGFSGLFYLALGTTNQ